MRIVQLAGEVVAGLIAAAIVLPYRRVADDIDALCDDPDFNGAMP